MSAVSQNSVVDQRRVVEALHVELGSILKTYGEKTEKNADQLSFTGDAHFILL